MSRKKSKTRRSRSQQLSLDERLTKPLKEFGGSLLKKSNAKVARPISTKHAMHIVLRSDPAKGTYSMLAANRSKKIQRIIWTQARRCGVRIYEYANVGNHLHILLRLSRRDGFRNFLRSITGLIARLVLGAEKGKAQGLKFWSYRPYSRLVDWKKGYQIAKDYVIQNHLEALGLVPYKTRKYKSKSTA
ncbi:MAG: transposase [Pseudobdellovibrionaceae bacterium]